MVSYAIENGIKLDESVLSNFDQTFRHDQEVQASFSELTSLHNYLVDAIHPISPQILKVRKQEIYGKTWLSRLSLIKKLIGLAIFFLIALFCLSLSKDVNGDPVNFNLFTNSGIPLLLNELFLLVSAGLGASFSALFKANRFVEQGTYDPSYETSYWIQVILGLVAGTILAMLIPIEEIERLAEGANQSHLSSLNGLGKPLLAIAGGFSANLVYKALLKIVQFLESVLDTVIPSKELKQISRKTSSPAMETTMRSQPMATPKQTSLIDNNAKDETSKSKGEKLAADTAEESATAPGDNSAPDDRPFMGFLKDFVVLGEGCRKSVYRDSLGIPTIGIGCNLNVTSNQDLIRSMGIDPQQLIAGSESLSDEQINRIFSCQINDCKKNVLRLFGNFENLSPLRQIVLLDMIFNLGYQRLSKFKNLRQAVSEQNFSRAAKEMKNSRWFQQVKNRGQRNVYIMENDTIEGAPFVETLDASELLKNTEVVNRLQNIA